jgi:hypothetical protein
MESHKIICILDLLSKQCLPYPKTLSLHSLASGQTRSCSMRRVSHLGSFRVREHAQVIESHIQFWWNEEVFQRERGVESIAQRFTVQEAVYTRLLKSASWSDAIRCPIRTVVASHSHPSTQLVPRAPVQSQSHTDTILGRTRCRKCHPPEVSLLG